MTPNLRPNDPLFDKCIVCGKPFKMGDDVYLRTGDPVCRNCTDYHRRMVPKHYNDVSTVKVIK